MAVTYAGSVCAVHGMVPAVLRLGLARCGADLWVVRAGKELVDAIALRGIDGTTKLGRSVEAVQSLGGLVLCVTFTLCE